MATLYLQVTTRCNMHCMHCMHSCTSQGIDMDSETFVKAITDPNYDEVCFGGGEPTLHPRIITMLNIAYMEHKRMSMVTNGSCDDDMANNLVYWAKRKGLMLHVSWDRWHNMDMVNPILEDYAYAYGSWHGSMESKIVDLVNAGRAKKNRDILDAEMWKINGKINWIEPDEDFCLLDPRISPSGEICIDAAPDTPHMFSNLYEASEAANQMKEQFYGK